MNVVGIMWGKNEGDILEEVITDALRHVDSLMVMDDDSTDRSWDIIQSFGSKLEYVMQRRLAPSHSHHPRLWARQHSLEMVRSRYKAEDTWVQVIESDMMLLDTNPRDAIRDHAVKDVAVYWEMINAYRPAGGWGPEVDKWPNWDRSIREVMPMGHWIETMLYTFRPVPEIVYTELKPWPRGFGAYQLPPGYPPGRENSPLLAHYGYRGPTHFYSKNSGSKRHPKYHSWVFENPASVLKTVSMFNGEWNRKLYSLDREGWIKWVNRKKPSC